LAEPSVDEEIRARPTRPRRRWYGWQTLLADGAIGLIAIAMAESDAEDAALAFAGVGFTLSGPIVHLAHGHPGKTVASLALRGGAVALIAAGAGTCDLRGGCGMLVFGVLGVPAAIVVDAAVIAREDAFPEPKRSVWVAPWLAEGGGGAYLGGTF
jgi:hypothetical protein